MYRDLNDICVREHGDPLLAHDRDLLGQAWAREGVEQVRRAELIER